MDNLKKKLIYCISFVLISGVLVTALVQNISADEVPLSCEVVSGTCDGVTVLKLQSTSGSHAEASDQSNYSYKICCSGLNIGNNCSGNHAKVLNLSAGTNAHVEENGQSNYTNFACLSYSCAAKTIVCNYANDCSTLGANYVCLASISGSTNAHVGDCNAYAKKVCCQVTNSASAPGLPIWIETP